MSELARFQRTLDQELVALLRGVSLECLVCGEFVLRLKGSGHFCPECGMTLHEPAAAAAAQETTGSLSG